jgi:hypothetical protein
MLCKIKYLLQRKNITIFSSLVAIFLLLVSPTGSLQKVAFATIKVNATNMAMSNMKNSTMNQSSMLQRGNIAMGFNQNKIIHHFIATPTGGEIMIVALNSSDNDTIKQIRNHILDIQKEFSQGNFTKPFYIHAQKVPGTKLMAEKQDLIRYSIKQINNGSVLLLTTNDQQLAAIHQFVAFQTAQHMGH